MSMHDDDLREPLRYRPCGSGCSAQNIHAIATDSWQWKRCPHSVLISDLEIRDIPGGTWSEPAVKATIGFNAAHRTPESVRESMWRIYKKHQRRKMIKATLLGMAWFNLGVSVALLLDHLGVV